MSEKLPVQIKSCELTQNSATFKPGMEWSEWLEAGQQLSRVTGATLWWVGDWLVYGQERFVERNEDGTFKDSARYKAALEQTGLEIQTLRNAAYVSSSIRIPSRVYGLSWTHHREVATMNEEEQMRWLNMAVVNQWSVSVLRQNIRQHNAVFKNDDQEPKLGLFKWLDAVFEVDKHLKSEDPSKWTEDRRRDIKKHLEPIATFYAKL